MVNISDVVNRHFAAVRNSAFAVILLFAAGTAIGQTNFGRISGVVSDSAGAAIPNAAVTVSDPTTNFSRTAMTDDSGNYTVTNLPVGSYTILVEMQGFKRAMRTQNSISSDSRLTVDITLETGTVSEVVDVVQASGETVNTTSGEVGKVIDNQQVDNLALNGRNYYQLLTVIPGAVITQEDALDTNLATNTININGNRGVSNNLTVDGGNNNNAGSNASQINNVGVDFIQEVKLQTSNFSAEYGRNSGAQINVTTKRGTNDFHGSLFEFMRNDAMDARSFFAPVKPMLRYHNYGYSIGGPLPFFNFGNGGPLFKSGKDKLFFFWGQEWKTIHRQAATAVRTLPTLDELNGNFSQRLTNNTVLPCVSGDPGCTPGVRVNGFLRDPLIATTPESAYVNNPNFPIASIMACGLVRQPGGGTSNTTNPARIPVRSGCFSNNMIPLGRITADGLALANVYRQMVDISSSFSNFPGGSNITFQPDSPANFRQELIRLDYVASPKHTIYGRYVHDSNENIDPYGTFTISQLPTIQHARNRPGNGLQVGHIWSISPTLINDTKVNFSWTDQIIPPANDLWARETYGFAYPQLFASGGTYENSIPDITFSGGFTGWAGAARSLVALAHDSMFSDTVTWVKNNHTVKFGFQYNFSKIQQNGRSTYAGNLAFNTNRTNSTTQVIGDMLLGNFRTYSEFAFDPVGKFRFQQYEGFVADSWKVTQRLSLELGVRYQFGTPFYTRGNNITNFDPALYDPLRAVAISRTGAYSIPAGANRFNGLIRAGDGVPTAEQYYIPSWNSADVNAVPTGSPRGLYDAAHEFMPRVGFAYSPFDNNRTAIRGGFGMYVDRVEGNIIFPLISNPPFVNSASFDNGNLADIRGGSPSALAVFGTISAIDPKLRTSRTMNFSLGVQHEFAGGIFVEANAIGNLGRNLIRNPDINTVPFERIIANAALPANQQFVENAMRPFLGYSVINQRNSDATSNYYAGQFYAAKRKGDFLATASYTWSKVLTDASGFNDNLEDPFNRKFNYGPASFDRRHVFIATYTYAPRWFRNSNSFVKAVFDGFEVSGISRYQSGRLYTITGNSATGGNRRADIFNAADIYLKEDRQWLNNTASTAPDFCPTATNPTPTVVIKGAFGVSPCNRRGTGGVSLVEGPGLMAWDFSVRKRIRFGEKMNLRLQADLFNAFNRANFSNLQTNVSAADFGQLIASGPGRSIQLGAKFQF